MQLTRLASRQYKVVSFFIDLAFDIYETQLVEGVAPVEEGVREPDTRYDLKNQ